MKYPDSLALKCGALALFVGAGAWAQQPGIIEDVAGNGAATFAGDSGQALSASLRTPGGVAFDSAGSMYIADLNNNRVRKVGTSGIITTIAGTGACTYTSDGVAATTAALCLPRNVAVNAAGDVFIADQGNQRIRKIDHSTGLISTVAGTGTANFNGDGGLATSAELQSPSAVALDTDGNLYIADGGNQRIRKVTASTGLISTVAGNGSSSFAGDGGLATSASLADPQGLMLDTAGNLYISDTNNNRVRRVDQTTGIILTIAGNGGTTFGGDGGPATSAPVFNPLGIALDAAGNLYICDYNSVIRKVDTTGTITTIAGSPGVYAYAGNDVLATTATFGLPQGLAVYGNGLYVADSSANRIREITLIPPAVDNLGSEAVNQTTAASTVTFNSLTGTAASYTMAYGTDFSVDATTCSGGANYGSCSVTFTPEYPGLCWDALLAKDSSGNVIGTEYVYGIGQGALGVVTPGVISSVNLSSLGSVRATGATFDPAGNLYLVDSPHDRVIKVDTSGNASVVTITGETLNTPSGIVVDGAGNLDIVDTGNNRIVHVSTSGVATAITPSVGLLSPTGIALATNGTLYVADSGNSRIVEIPPSGTSSVLSLSTSLTTPVGVTFDDAGNLYIADSGLHSVVTLPSGGTSSVLNTSVTLSTPAGISTDAAGDVYVADSGLNEVFRISPAGVATVIAGTGTAGDTGDGRVATSAELNVPTAVAVTPDGTVYITDTQALRKISATSMTFASTTVGATSTEYGSVTNIGNQPFAFTAAFSFGQNPSEFSLLSTSALFNNSLAAAASWTFQAQFAPTIASNYTDTLTLTTGLQISFSGTGLAPPPAPPAPPSQPANPIVPSSSGVSVPSLFVDGSSAAQTITLTNTGVNAMNIGSFALAGPNAADFTIATACGTTLAAGAACTISVTFTPSVTGNESATLAITYADAVSGVSYTQNVSLSGPGLSGLPSGTVEILNRNSGQALDVLLQSTADGAPLQQYAYLGLPNQQWQFVLVEPGYYKIVNVNSGLVLDVTAESTEDGAKIQQWTYLGTDNQKWSVTQLSDGSFQIINKLSGKLLDVTALSVTDGARIQQWDSTGANNQKWSIIAAQQYFTIANKLSGKVLDVTGLSRSDGALIQQWSSLGGENQEWQFVSLGNGYYQILNHNSGLVLDATDPSGTVSNGTLVQQWDYLGGENQQWQLIPTGGGYFEIANRANGMVLDVRGLSTSDGASIQLWDYLGGANQQWSIAGVR